MKILFVADEESRSLWDFYTPSKLQGAELIISCGDLDPAYLEFLVTMANVPLLYVCGNHDGVYLERPPQGCTCIEGKVYDFKGLRILGLGGSMRYCMGEYMYTEREMRFRILRAQKEILLKNGFDLLVTHAPPRGYGDLEDLPHRGFACFGRLLDKHSPRYMVHGHIHKGYGLFKRQQEHPSGTVIVNAYERVFLEMQAGLDYPAEGQTGSLLYDLYKRVGGGSRGLGLGR